MLSFSCKLLIFTVLVSFLNAHRIVSYDNNIEGDKPFNFVNIDRHYLNCLSSWSNYKGSHQLVKNSTIFIELDAEEGTFHAECAGIPYDFNVYGLENYHFELIPPFPQLVERNTDSSVTISYLPALLKRDQSFTFKITQLSGPSKLGLTLDRNTLMMTVPKNSIEGQYSIKIAAKYGIYKICIFQVKGTYIPRQMAMKQNEEIVNRFNLQNVTICYVIIVITIWIRYFYIEFRKSVRAVRTFRAGRKKEL